MRYAIISDIHANLPAWKNVLADLADLKVDRIICLGDVVGYGPDPVGVLESVYRVVHVTLLGNHDAALCGKIDPGLFSSRAHGAILRHRALVSPKGMGWLGERPLVLNAPGFCCTHGDFAAPAAFHYIIDPPEAMPSWKATTAQLLFVGHTHVAGIHVIGASGVPHIVEPCDFQMEEGKRYIVNPGSVGYPRASDCRASYCVFDSAANSITFRSLPFDCEGYRKALLEAGLEDDPWLAEKTARRSLPLLRERLSFSRPLTSDQQARDVQRQATLRPRLSRRQAVALSLALLLAGGAAALGAFHAGRQTARDPLAVSVPSHDLPSLNAFPLLPPDKNLLPEVPPAVGADGLVSGWRYAVEDRALQTLGIGLRDGALTLRVVHAEPRRFELESPLINLAGTNLRALRLAGRAHRLDGFAGSVLFQLVTYVAGPDGRPQQDATERFEARDAKRKGAATVSLSRKIEIPRRATHVKVRVEAAFTGALELDRPLLAGEDTRVRGTAQAKASTP
jgi:predicted phosphodiesterase